MPHDRHYRPDPTLTWRDEPGLSQLLIFDERTERYVTLNPMASQIWRRLAAGWSVQAIVEALSERHDAPTAQVQRDVQSFIDQALAAQLLTETSGVAA